MEVTGVKSGGDDEIRTHDLCSAIAALSQLSYIPGKGQGYRTALPETGPTGAPIIIP